MTLTNPLQLSSSRALLLVCALLGFVASSRATVPAPEKLLPDDTLILVTAPDFPRLREIWSKTPQSQFWNDPAMRPFKEHFVSKWNEDLLKPLERDLGIKLADYAALLQGQITFALIRNGWQGGSDPAPGAVLLVDSKDKKDQLKQALADLRKKMTDSGKTLRTEKVHEIDFTVVGLSSNDIPKSLSKLVPHSTDAEDEDDNAQPKKAADKSEWVFGQVDSLLVVGSSPKAVEKIVVRLSGGTVPQLGELAAYQASHLAMFREAPLYAWVNTRPFIDILLQKAGEKKEDADAPNPFDISPDKIVNALGLGGLKSVALSFQNSDQGMLFQAFLNVPETARQGIFKILAGEPKEANPPPFVPADSVKFQRWRIDGQKTWAALQRMVNDISPQWLSGINFLLETANTAAKEKDPNFDVKKNLIGNLGDDVISYEKAARGSSFAELASPPSIVLIGSPHPEELAIALKNLLVLVGQQTGAEPEEREFLGRKIYSIPLRSMGLPMGNAAASGSAVTLRYTASKGYLALSTDASILEEFLRSSDSPGKPLSETRGLNEAAQKVLTPGTSLFGYQNETEAMRGWFELLRKGDSSTNSPMTAVLAGINQNIKDWVDFSLLPPFD
ncbi:MAG TPA: hypothetical protein VHI52_16165, partial [Verrucomicrobiae bacterium]|nr:hypothetical protein [Verrucomicrobiae bacterium]